MMATATVQERKPAQTLTKYLQGASRAGQDVPKDFPHLLAEFVQVIRIEIVPEGRKASREPAR